MPSSMIFLGLVVLWLLILVPAVARHRQEVARPSTAALSARVLDRPGPAAERGPVRDRGRRGPARARDQEVDVTEHEEQQPRSVAVAEQEGQPTAPDREWQPPAPRYRRGRGGYDPEAAALAARARYAFRQRVVLAMLVSVVATAVIAGFWTPWVWWLHAVADLALVGYLAYLRRQVRLEEAIRQRRAARMAGTRRISAAEDPELDEWARRGRAAASGPHSRHRDDDHDDHPDDSYDDDHDEDDEDDADPDEPDADTPHPATRAGADDDADEDDADLLAREEPERVAGTGAPLWRGPGPGLDMMEVETALPRMQPVPPPPLPAGTSLVETDPDDPELHELDGPLRPDYRRAVGE